MAGTNVLTRFRWFVLFAICVSTVSTTTIQLAPAAIMGSVAKDLGVDLGTATSAVMGAFAISVGISCLLGGALIDRFGFATIALGSIVLLVASSLLYPFVQPSIKSIVIVRILQGFGSGPILVTMSPAAALWFERTERGIAAGLQGFSVYLGVALGLVSGPLIFSANGGNWQAVFSWLSILGIVGFILILIVALGPKAPFTKVKAAGTVKEKLTDFQLALRQPVTWLGALIFICGSWILQAFNDLSPAYLAIAPPIGVGLGPVAAGGIMVFNILGGMIAAVSSGFLMKKVTNMQAKPIVITGFIFAAIFTYSISISFIHSHMPVLAIALVLAGLNGLTMPCCVAFIALCYPPSITGRVEGMWQGIGIFGGAFGVFAGAAALTATGNYQMSFVIVSAVAIVAIILSLFINPSKAFCVNEEGRVVRASEV